MKSITNLYDDISIQFGKLIESLDATNFNTIISFILTTFATDFPEIKANAYKLSNLTTGNTYKIYLDSISDDFLEPKIIIPVKSSNSSIYRILDSAEIISMSGISLEELYSIQLASDYINEMSSYTTPKKPLILTDTTGSYITIDRDCVVFISCERIIDINNIPEYVYSIIQPYAFYKFVDFIINQNFGNVLDMNKKIFDLMYNSIQNDLTTGDTEVITSIALSGLSISFANNLQNYATTLSNLQSSASNPAFIEQMNKLRDKQQGVFKRKKRIFYNFIF